MLKKILYFLQLHDQKDIFYYVPFKKTILTLLIVGSSFLAGIVYQQLAIQWSIEPKVFKIKKDPFYDVKDSKGQYFINTIINITGILLYKDGGYISNDLGLPGIWLDNIKNWGKGVLIMLRNSILALQNHPELKRNKNLYDSNKLINSDKYWALPSAEYEYEKFTQSLRKL